MGRELLAEVVASHPFMVSVLTTHVNQDMARLGQVRLMFLAANYYNVVLKIF